MITPTSRDCLAMAHEIYPNSLMKAEKEWSTSGSAAAMQVPLPSFLERKERDPVAQSQSSSRVERGQCGSRRARTQRIPYMMCHPVHSLVGDLPTLDAA